MSDDSRKAALEKLHNIFFECGHQTHWTPEDWDVSPTSYFDNSIKSCEERKKEKLKRLNEGPDRRRWSMSVMSVNSYYDNAVNGLFITAGMLQKPFFDAGYDMARNFGGVGAIMGHELTHGFDNTGRKYDQESRLKDWWDKETIDEFRSRGACIAQLYSGFEMLGLHIKGNATLGENIADFGGIKSAYHGWEAWWGAERCKGISKDEMPMTWELCQRRKDPPLAQRQLFWVAYGQNWCDKERDPSIKVPAPPSARHATRRAAALRASEPPRGAEAAACTVWRGAEAARCIVRRCRFRRTSTRRTTSA
jgi:predicted metalloendopeptidase